MPKNDGAKADTAESIERKRIEVFMVLYDLSMYSLGIQIAFVDLHTMIIVS